MRCAILAIGTRGDVQPLVALGAGLRRAGVDVTFATHRDFEPLARAHGFEYRPLTGNPVRFYNGAGGYALQERLRDPDVFTRFFDHYLSQFFERILHDSWEAARGADLVLSWNACAPGLSERLGVPVFIANPYPPLHLPTFAFPNPFQPPFRFDLGPITNRLSYRRGAPIMRMGGTQLNRWRRDALGLPALDADEHMRRMRRLPHLLGFSPAILPRPRDWRSWVHVTGTWTLDDMTRYEPPGDLAAFLEAGPPPVAVGFSSSVGRNAGAVTRAIVDGITAAGQRGLLVAGFGGLAAGDLPPHVFRVPSVPYGWLLPRVAAMIHHGGAGSTAWALGSGIPNMAIPFGYDQILWGNRIHALGAGPKPIPANQVTAAGMRDAVAALTGDVRLRDGAKRAAAAIAREDGVAEGVRVLLAAAR